MYRARSWWTSTGTVTSTCSSRNEVGQIIFFERSNGGWAWRTDRFQDLDVGEWYRFVDLDGDGDADLLGESRFGYIQAWRNTGSRNRTAVRHCQ